MPRPLPANYLAGTSGDDTLDIRGFVDDYTVKGLAGNDTIYGGSGHDSLDGGRGNDLIYASADDAAIIGGAGLDTVSFLNSATGVWAELISNAFGPWPTTTPSSLLKNIENVIGSDYDDVISGSGRVVNELDGGAGNDRLIAYGSGDFLTGGTGADTFDVRPVIGSGRRGTDTVTVTDFQYNDGDRIDAGPVTPAQLDWVFEPANGAWIGTWDLPSEATFELIVLGADTDPSEAWFI
jgi:Ca2+-binding RTX toxin-like protein